MDHWPPLAWLAECPLNNETTQIYHGTGVETRKDWFCEAVWDGEFPAGDFDKTDIVAGSGSRIGEAIAATLGIPCHVVDRDAWRSASLAEVPFIACSGSVGDLAFKSAESHLQGSVLLSGPSGDTIWGKNTIFLAGMTIGGGSMLGFTEYRLWAGFINCPVPSWFQVVGVFG